MKRVAVVFGGQSTEHDISIITGQFIIAALRAAKEYEIFPVYVAKDGKWFINPKLGELETFQDPNFEKNLQKIKNHSLQVDGRFRIYNKGKLKSGINTIDMVFPALHGTFGEDGSLMGLLRMANVPFVGCDLQASVIAMDKVLTKQVTGEAGIPSVPYLWFNDTDWVNGKKALSAKIRRLKLPWFVKPAHLGSSIGITRVEHAKDLENAVEVALHYDNKVIVEQGIANLTEVNCAVLGNNDELQTSLLEQPVFKSELLSFDEKYIGKGKKGGTMGGGKEATRIPAPIGRKLTSDIQALAKRAFQAIGACGTARLDFLIDNKAKSVYLNEINPLPGSLQQHLWKASGISNVELVKKLITLAEQKFAERKKLTTVFKSSVLHQSPGKKGQS